MELCYICGLIGGEYTALGGGIILSVVILF